MTKQMLLYAENIEMNIRLKKGLVAHPILNEGRIMRILSLVSTEIWGEFGRFLYLFRCMINPKVYP